MKSIARRFITKVKKTEGCWIWLGSKNRKGYGQISTTRAGQPITTHRASYQLFIGNIPKGVMVLHKCDNPACVNPAHLSLGTAAENTKDMIERERGWWQKNGKGQSRKSDVMFTYKGKTQCISAWARETGINKKTLGRRLLKGMSIEDAIETPINQKMSRSR